MKRLSVWLAFFGLVLFLSGCRDRSQGDEGRLEPVRLTFEVFNHTQGYLSTFVREAVPFTRITLRVGDLHAEGVDSGRIVVREDRFGRLKAAGNKGQAVFTAPDSDRLYSVYLANSGAGADYRVVDYWVGPLQGILRVNRTSRFGREDRNGYSGPESPLWEAVELLDAALSYSWAEYGHLKRADSEAGAEIALGYGHCADAFGLHTLLWAGVNPRHCRTEEQMLATFLEEIFELVTGTADIGRRDTAEMITDPETGRLNDVGRDLFAYVYVKDER